MKISKAIDSYLYVKRASNLSYKTEENTLRQFERHVKDVAVAEVTFNQVREFLIAPKASNNTSNGKHRCLRMFFEFLFDRGHISSLAMPPAQVRNDRRIPASFVYKRAEIQRMLKATRTNQEHGLCSLGEETFRALLLTLYGTGAMVSEILWLKRSDLDLKRDLVSLCGDRLVLARRVPIGVDLHRVLVNHLSSKDHVRHCSPNVFVCKDGSPLKRDTVADTFSRLRMRAGVFRRDGVRPPRMRDLRQTFAVHRITSWINEGADLNRMIPALSAYMGLATFDSALRFLHLTPERFKRELDLLSPGRNCAHWRDEPELMRFLAGL